MFRKMILTAVLSAATFTAAHAQDDQQWKLGVMMTSLGGGDRGVMINQVFDSSPAQEIGLEPGDVLLTINGGLASDPLAVRDTIFANDSVSLVIRRGQSYYQKDVTFGAPPEPPPGGGENGGGSVVAAVRPGTTAYGARPRAVAAAPKAIKSVKTRAISPPKPVVKPLPKPVYKPLPRPTYRK